MQACRVSCRVQVVYLCSFSVCIFACVCASLGIGWGAIVCVYTWEGDVMRQRSKLLSTYIFGKSFLFSYLNWKLKAIWIHGIPASMTISRSLALDTGGWALTPLGHFSFLHLRPCFWISTKKSQPSIKIGNANIRKKQPLIHWGVRSMRAGLFFFHSHIASVWSIAEAQLQELTVNRAYWKIHHEVGPFFFFFFIASIWPSGKAGKGSLL